MPSGSPIVSKRTPALLVSPHPATRSAPTLIDALERGASLDAPFLTFHGSGAPRRFAARAALDSARSWAGVLSAHGVRTGQPVAILLPTSSDFVGALLGAMLLGALPVPLAAPMTFGPIDRYLQHLHRIAVHAGARALVTSPRIRSALDSIDLRGHLRSVIVPSDVDKVAPRPRGPSSLDPSMPALLQYTSGTTGRPKGVVVSHRALMSNTAAIAQSLGITSGDVGVSWLPLYHDMGLVGALLTAVAHPYELHVLAPEAFVMRPRRWLELVSEQRATLSTAPNFGYDHAARRAGPAGLDLSSWRVALDGAEPVHASTLERFAARFAPAGLARAALTPCYGLAEATLAVTLHARRAAFDFVSVDRHVLDARGRVVPSAGPTARSLVSVGTPVPGTAIAITDPRGRARSEGEVGEIRVSGPGLMDGYYRDERGSADVLAAGWLRTGDLGFVHDGRLFVSGRVRELIIHAGRNVHPEDVEEVACEADPRIRAAAAFGRTSETLGTDELVLMLEARGLTEVEREQLATRVRGEILATIGVRASAVSFWPVGALPRTSSGKVRRKDCASLHGSRAGVDEPGAA